MMEKKTHEYKTEPLLVGGGDEGLKLGKEGCGKGVGRVHLGRGTECAGALRTRRRGKRRPDPTAQRLSRGAAFIPRVMKRC